MFVLLIMSEYSGIMELMGKSLRARLLCGVRKMIMFNGFKIDYDEDCACKWGGSIGENPCKKHPWWSECQCPKKQCRFHFNGTITDGPHCLPLVGKLMVSTEKYRAAENLIRELLPCCNIVNCEAPPTYVNTMSEFPKQSFYCDKHYDGKCARLPYADLVNAWLRAGGRFF